MTWCWVLTPRRPLLLCSSEYAFQSKSSSVTVLRLAMAAIWHECLFSLGGEVLSLVGGLSGSSLRLLTSRMLLLLEGFCGDIVMSIQSSHFFNEYISF